MGKCCTGTGGSVRNEGGALLELDHVDGQPLRRERAGGGVGALIGQRLARRRGDGGGGALDVGAGPGGLLGLDDLDGGVGDADPREGRPGDPLQPAGGGHVGGGDVAVADAGDDGDGGGIEAVVGVGAVVSGHPECPLHCLHHEALHEDVPHISSPSDSGLDPHAGFCVHGGDVLCAHVLDPAGHLAAESYGGAGGGDAGEPPYADLPARHAHGDAVLIPTAFDGDAVVAGDDVAVLDPDL